MERDEFYRALCSSDNELKHHGILKQKWGQRNGPPYPLSRSQKSAAEKKAEYKTMSDEELKAKTDRLRAENAYRDEVNKQRTKKGESIIKESLKASGKTALTIMATSMLVQAGKKALTTISPEFVDGMEWMKINKK